MIKVDKFNVRVVKNGDKFGRDFCLAHDDERPMVEFYDSRYPHSEFGQFIRRYYAGTLLGHEGFFGGHPDSGLCLDGGNADEWSVSVEDMDTVRRYITEAIS